MRVGARAGSVGARGRACVCARPGARRSAEGACVLARWVLGPGERRREPDSARPAGSGGTCAAAATASRPLRAAVVLRRAPGRAGGRRGGCERLVGWGGRRWGGGLEARAGGAGMRVRGSAEAAGVPARPSRRLWCCQPQKFWAPTVGNGEWNKRRLCLPNFLPRKKAGLKMTEGWGGSPGRWWQSKLQQPPPQQRFSGNKNYSS